MRHVGPFHSPPPGNDLEAFITRMEEQMRQTLADLRAGSD
jgi:hypothetical protein